MRLLALSISFLIGLSACEQANQANKQSQANSVHLSELAAIPQDFATHWLTPRLILLPKQDQGYGYQLAKQEKGQLTQIALQRTTFPDRLKAKYPHLKNFQAYSIDLPKEKVKQWLKHELFVLHLDSRQQAVKRSYVQTASLLDELYTSGTNDANEATDLGASINQDSVTFKLWAPTAQSVTLMLFNPDKTPAADGLLKMTEDTATGIWSVKTGTEHSAAYYQYQISVYHPASKKVETLVTTDPYSLSLSTNSEYSQVVDLSHPETLPNGWAQQKDNLVNNPEDNIFYETHIRDFSAHDAKLSDAGVKGKYKAFSEQNSDGIKHLKSLRDAGINNIHLLPTFDIGTVNENSKTVIDLQDPVSKVCRLATMAALCEQNIDSKQTIADYLASLPAEDESRQAIVTRLKTLDNYNWGYDPFHYTVPEGSYAVNPEGHARIVEFREMVQAIHNLGFRLIMDVVYNHTHQAGLEPTAVLDKIVPNYYHRLDPVSGEIAQSTCCDNTATERAMMEKLMIDSLVVWARDYKIDGFRFDLMAHQPRAAMLRAREAVQAVDKDTYFYGEGWNFGEIANNQRFVQASQLELSGTQIGTFTDRLRDAVRGGAFSAQGKAIRQSQGIGNGLGTYANELNQADPQNFLANYLLFADQLRIGLTGNLADFPLENAQGKLVTGKDIPYGDQPTGYALDPADTINYVSKHDNQTLWDNNQYRLPYDMSPHDRVRAHLQSLAFPILAQGIPFLHMGSELLRSKAFLRDSYDYSDWFNKVDFSKQDNNYNVGLPPYEKDQANWTVISEVLKHNQGRDLVSSSDIQFSADIFNELIKIRMSTPLFRLTSAEDIIARMKFHNTGKDQQLGLIVMSINDAKQQKELDKNIEQLVVIFNTSLETKSFAYTGAQHFSLHPVQQQSKDKVLSQSSADQSGFSIPALTTAVFVKPSQPLH